MGLTIVVDIVTLASWLLYKTAHSSSTTLCTINFIGFRLAIGSAISGIT